MLPLSLPALSTLTIFTFVNTWNDFLGPLIYLTKTELKTIQIGLRMFITQYSAEYGLIMAASVVALIPVLIVFLSLQKYFVQGVASTGIKAKQITRKRGVGSTRAPHFCRNREKVLCYILNRMKRA